MNKDILNIKMIKPCVLLSKKTYGRHKNGKLLYRCVPDDKTFDIIDVPYEYKKTGFLKIMPDLYVLVDYENKIISDVLGPIDNYDSFWRYRLKCKNLEEKQLKITSFKPAAYEKLFKFYEPRLNHNVFSIDGEETKDYDDAFSIEETQDFFIISVYISNIPSVINSLCIHFNENLWQNFNARVTTIYLPEKIITMLPDKIVEAASLSTHKIAPVIVMDLKIKKNTFEYEAFFKEVLISPYKNHVYESEELFNDKNYQLLKSCVNILSEKYYSQPVDNSYEVVEYLMRFMCFEAGAFLYKNNKGVFRTINEPLEDLYPSNSYTSSIPPNMQPYVHITSPIRRLPDIINQIELLNIINSNTINDNCNNFKSLWLNNIDYINTTSKGVKRVQNETKMLYLYPTIKDKTFKGKILERETVIEENTYNYTVFIKELNLLVKFISLTPLSGEHTYGLTEIKKKSNFRKKIRLYLID